LSSAILRRLNASVDQGANPDRRVFGAFATVVLLGGTNLVLVVVTTRKLGPFWAAGLRSTGAAILAFAAAAALHLAAPRGRAYAVSVVYGILAFGLGFGLFFWGTRHVPAGIASVILGCVPLLTFLLAVAQGLERFRIRGLVGAVLAILGIGVISAEAPSGSLPILPLLAVVGAAVATAEAAITVRRIPGEHPLPVNAVGMAAGAVLLMLASAVADEPHQAPWSAGVMLPLTIMIVTSPLLFELYVVVVQRWSASAAAYQLVLFPLVSIPLSALLLDETISLSLLVGAPLVLLGVYVGALAPDRHRSQVIGTENGSRV
jgi:drug/metabolite transporter (DMT)-like permease